MNNLFCGLTKQIRFIFRKERITSTIWISSIIIISALVASVYSNIFATAEDIFAMANLFEMPAMAAILGPIYGIENITTGALYSASMLLFTVVALAIMNIFFVLRHTRSDEENGRIELIRSLPTGRLSNLGATMTVAVVINLALSLLTALTLSVLSIPSMDFGGCVLYGFSLGISGIVFACITAVIAQLSSSSRTCMGISMGVLGVLYILRAVGDVGSQTLSLISPLGMILRTQCYANNYWWPVIVIFVISVAFAMLAFYLNSIRDTNQGILKIRQSKVKASTLKSSHGLTIKLIKNAVIAWAASLLIFGLVYGSVMGDMESLINGNEFLKSILIPPEGHTQTEMFITLIISMIAVMSAVPSMGSVLKLSNEEKHHRIENIMSKAVSRQRVLAGYVIIAFIESFIMLFVSMLGLWAACSIVMETPITFIALFSSIMVYLPAIWVAIGIATVLHGIIPDKASAISYGYLGFSFLLLYLGRMMDFPSWTKYFSPFGYIPQLPVDTVNFLTLALLTVTAGIFVAGGFILYRRRDLI